MTEQATQLRGVIRGRTIQLADAISLPDGQEVNVTVMPISTTRLAPGEGIRLSAGACADEAAEWDEFDRWYREQRKEGDHPPIEDDEE